MLMTGDAVKNTGTYHCDRCNKDYEFKKGDKAPKCTCGNTTFKERKPEVAGKKK